MKISPRLKKAVTWPLSLLLIMWLVFGLEHLLQAEWFIYGVAPRKVHALRGIFTTPFLHGGLAHIISNSLPFLVLMSMILFFYERVAIPVLLTIYLGTGICMWFFADPEAIFSLSNHSNYHIGASGVVYGMAAFLAFTGLFRKNIRAIAISLVIVFYYGGMIWGVLPIKEGVSWEGHLLGAIVGVFSAYWFRDRIEKAEAQKTSYGNEHEPERAFLEPDVFERKKNGFF